MTTYSIVKAINDSVNNAFLGQERYYVVFADGPRVGTRENIIGYATDESAKRRIRDLKRKEAQETATVTINPDMINAQIIDVGEIVVAADSFTIAPAGSGPIGLLTINKHGDIVQNPAIAPDTLDDDMRKFVAVNVTKPVADNRDDVPREYGKTYHPNGNVSMPIKKALFDWDGKLTADEKAMITRPATPSWFGKDATVRHVGVYPHVRKREYAKRYRSLRG